MTDAHARRTDPSTSHDAAARMAVTKMEDAVYAFLVPYWPRYLSVIEIADGMGVDKWTISPRLRPLLRKGLVDYPIKLPTMNSNGHIRELQAWRVKRVHP